MKKIAYLLGLIAPILTSKVLAKEFILAGTSNIEPIGPIKFTDLSKKEINTLKLYEDSSQYERAFYIYKVIATSAEQLNSGVNQEIINQRVENILRLSEEDQRLALIQEIRNGGIRWGRIGDPTKATF
jgi:hypothetical protein